MTNVPLLSTKNIILIFIDLQERLLKAIPDSERLVKRNCFLLECAKAFGVPILATTQYRKGLGDIVPAFGKCLNSEAMDKNTFSCGMDPTISAKLKAINREWIVVSGVETHICILQTILDLLRSDYSVAIVADAIGARDDQDHHWGLKRAERSGALVVTSEMLIYELLRRSDSEDFKKILPLIKQSKT
jgi:nicotinamidase-related amidase